MRRFDDVDQQVGLVRETPMDGCRIRLFTVEAVATGCRVVEEFGFSV
jgi:hypothetical protein